VEAGTPLRPYKESSATASENNERSLKSRGKAIQKAVLLPAPPKKKKSQTSHHQATFGSAYWSG
jgi:hypothetical protein